MNWLIPHQQHISQQYLSAKLAHAYLISGYQGSGKNQLAYWLAQLLLCTNPVQNNGVLSACKQCKSCQLLQSKTHPDFFAITSEKTSLGVDDIRSGTHFLQKTSQLGGRQVVVITAVETMTIAAANAILKTLEEPSANSVVILLTNDVNQLLATIISRCQKIEIRPPVGNELANYLKLEQADSFLNISQVKWLMDETLKDEFHQFIENLQSAIDRSSGFISLADELSEPDLLLPWLEYILSNLVRAEQGWQNAIISGINVNQAQLLLKEIAKAKAKISRYIQANKTFIIEQLLVSFETIMQNEG